MTRGISPPVDAARRNVARGGTTVTVACVRLGLAPELQLRAAEVLPPEMRARMDRYRLARDREAYLVARLALLQLLRERGYGDDCLASLTFGANGKPHLAGCELNLSHSGDHVLCAVGDGGPIGVDVEQLRPLDVDELRRFFSDAQWQSIAAAPEPQREFFRLWTLLESVLKADGGGLSTPAASIELDGSTARLQGALWHLHPLAIDAGYAAHLATREARPTIELRRLRAEETLAASFAAPIAAPIAELAAGQ